MGVSMPSSKEELRREKRVKSDHAILVSYPSQDGSNKEEKHYCKTKDISEAGLKIVTGRPLPLGCVIPIEIYVEKADTRFSFNGEVKWCLETNDAPTYFAGIKLLKIIKQNYQEWRAIANESVVDKS